MTMDYQKTWEVMSDLEAAFNKIVTVEFMVEDSGIRAIHPDKMEEWAEHLVRKLKK